MPPTRVLLALPQMLSEIVTDILRDRPEIELAQEPPFDVVVVSAAGPGLTSQARAVLYDDPRQMVLSIDTTGDRAYLHELAPLTRPLGDLSPASLVLAIAGAKRDTATSPPGSGSNE
jgi:hypothetical protein